MTKFFTCCSFFAAFFYLMVTQIAFANSATFSPVGNWKTIDEMTGVTRSIVQLKIDQNHELTGRVVKIYPRPGVDVHEKCIACSGKLKNQPVMGMTVLWGFKQSASYPNEWKQGYILDPKNGKIYHSTITVIDQAEKLRVRGYIGIPLFGRTQIWPKAK